MSNSQTYQKPRLIDASRLTTFKKQNTSKRPLAQDGNYHSQTRHARKQHWKLQITACRASTLTTDMALTFGDHKKIEPADIEAGRQLRKVYRRWYRIYSKPTSTSYASYSKVRKAIPCQTGIHRKYCTYYYSSSHCTHPVDKLVRLASSTLTFFHNPRLCSRRTPFPPPTADAPAPCCGHRQQQERRRGQCRAQPEALDGPEGRVHHPAQHGSQPETQPPVKSRDYSLYSGS